jgi:hypothetical protein
LLGKHEGKRPLCRPRRRWDGYIKMKLQEIRLDNVVWFDVAQDREKLRAVLTTVLNLRVL